jgi:hypothetical protein
MLRGEHPLVSDDNQGDSVDSVRRHQLDRNHVHDLAAFACRARRVAAAALVATLACAGSSAAAATVGGGAYGISANVNAVLAPVSVGAAPSVTLPAEGGGPFTESLLSANLAGLLPVRLAEVTTEGNSARGSASSSATALNASVAGLVTVSAARSRCSATATSAQASASVADLVVAGIPISTVDVGPNTTISLPVGRVILNEQRLSGASDVSVSAVHVILSAAVVTGDVVIAHSRCTVRPAARTRAKKLRRARSVRRG